MKIKTINLAIHWKVQNWIKSIDDEDLRKEIAGNVIVTGGCITSMLLDEEVNDYDIYFRNSEIALKVAKYYVNQFSKPDDSDKNYDVKLVNDQIKIFIRSAGVATGDTEESEEVVENYQYFEGRPDEQGVQYIDSLSKKIKDMKECTKYKPAFVTSNAITLSGDIQLVLRFFGEPDEIHDNYDFVHCTNYWTDVDSKCTLRQKALEAILTKELVYVGSKYPLCSLLRIRKFVARGWTINAGQILKIVMQLNKLDLEDFAVLEDQLVGVDVAYFHDLIEKLKEKDSDRVSSTYIAELIDTVFE